ncbi:Epithelial sodium channel [Trinorchestia longiramus]|nr:Epithelial sodium channel [Trinorchestia longiramus]
MLSYRAKMGVFDGGTAEADLQYQYSSKDKKWAMYCAYLGKEEDWLQPPSQFLPHKDDNTRAALLRQRFNDFLDSFTAHGPGRAHNNTNFVRRFIWTVLFAMCLLYGLYQCYNVLEEYLTYPKSVSIEMLSERKVDFPAVSLCNLNPLNVKDEVSHDKIYGGFVELENDNVEAKCSGLTPNTDDPLDKEMCSPYNKSCSTPEKASMSTLVDDGLRPTSSPLEAAAGSDTVDDVTDTLNSTLVTVPTLDPLLDSLTTDGPLRNLTSTGKVDALPPEAVLPTETTTSDQPRDSHSTEEPQSSSTSTSNDPLASLVTDTVSNTGTGGNLLGLPILRALVQNKTFHTITTDDNFDTLAGKLNDTLGAVTGALNDTLGAVTGVLNNTLGAVAGAVNDTLGAVTGALNDTLGAVGGAVNNTLGAVTGAVNDTLGAVGGAVNNTLGAVTGAVNDTLGAVGGAVNNTLGAVAGAVNDTLGAVGGAVNDTLGAVGGAVNDTLGAVAGTLNNTLGTAAGTLNDTINSIGNALANPLGTAAGGLPDSLEGLGVGGNTIPPAPDTPKATTATLGSAIDDTVNALGSALGSLGNVVGGLLGRKKRSSYTEDGISLFTEYERRNHERSRRWTEMEPQYSMFNETNTTLTMPQDAIHFRIRCSFIYQSLVKRSLEEGNLKTGLGISLEENGVTYGDTTSQCDMEWSTVEETIRYNLACHSNIYCDIYGCYYNVTHEYWTKTLQNGSVITSCSSSPVRKKDLYAEDETKNITKVVVEQIIKNSRTNDLSDVVSRYAPTKQQLEEYMRPSHQFIQLCSIDQTHCSYKLFHGFLSKEYGQCFTFNSPHLDVEGDPPLSDADRRTMFVSRSTFNTGPEGGLRLTLNLNTAKYVSLLSPNTGLRLVLHAPWDAPFPEDTGFNLSPGESHSVGVTKVVMNRVGEPHGQCTTHEFSKFDYTRTLCTKLCLERQYRERCKCKVNEGPVYDLLEEMERPVVLTGADNRTCNPFSISDDTCMQAVYDFFTSESFNCGCSPACREVKYDAHVTSNSQNRRFLKVAQNTRNIDTGTDICNDTDESTVRVHVYLASPDYTQITESPSFTYNTLVSNTGGNLGLFIGMSIVSFFEVFDLLVDVLLILFSPALYLKTISSRHVQVTQETQNSEPRKVFILAGPPNWLPHGKSDLLQLEEPEGSSRKIFTAS